MFSSAKKWLVIAIMSGLFAAPAVAGNNFLVRTTDTGKVRGIEEKGMLAYQGIPYARPPVGKLRWRPPQPAEKWEGVRDAARLADFCPQNADLGVFGKPGGHEDCLYINVYADKSAVEKGSKMPVFVWIYSGSLFVGASNDYDPRQLVMDGKAVVVTFNYRLGTLGFFAHPAISRENQPTGSYGQMDQSLALDWVQRNIAEFGGDPGNVTISGESSGGNSTMAHILSPWSRGKFQHAIAMSGAATLLRSPHFGAARSLKEAEQTGVKFAEAAGCSDQTAECLRALPLSKILQVQPPYMHNQSVLDGDFLPSDPKKAFESGNFNKVTFVNGTTRDEGNFFAGFTENETGKVITEENYPAQLIALFGEDLGRKVAKEYSPDDYNSASEAYGAAMTSYLFACPANQLNRLMSPYVPVYVYEFADRTAPNYLKPTAFPLGAAHTHELPYLFPNFKGGAGEPNTALNPLQQKLSDEMAVYWTTVAQAKLWKNWQPYSAEKPQFLRLTLPYSQMTDIKNFVKEHHCDFWDQTGVY